jgi:hypothetical protein
MVPLRLCSFLKLRFSILARKSAATRPEKHTGSFLVSGHARLDVKAAEMIRGDGILFRLAIGFARPRSSFSPS